MIYTKLYTLIVTHFNFRWCINARLARLGRQLDPRPPR